MRLKSFLAIIFVLSFSSCGPLFTSGEDTVLLHGQTRQFATSDPSFSSQIQTFTAHARTLMGDPNFEVGDVPINFGDTENPEFDGVCFIYSNGDREIIIKKEWWDNANASKREMMIFHELGHCRLNRDHNDGTLTNQTGTFKQSIMHPILPDTISYNRFKGGYLSELFTQQTTAFLVLLGID